MASPLTLDQLILFVTSACNLSCEGCFYLERLNSKDDMSFEQIKSIANSSGKVRYALLTGGEPFLRKDIDRIIRLFIGRCNVAINTNGFFPSRVKDVLTPILSKKPSYGVVISVSIDGFEATHNKMRGNNQSFSKALDTLRILFALRERYRGLSIAVNTVISPANLDELVDFAKEFAAGFNLNRHNFEIERANPDAAKSFILQRIKLAQVYKSLLRVILKRYPYVYLIDRARFKVQYANVVDGRLWNFPCLAGKKAVVIYPDGMLSACEMRPKKINLADFDYNLAAALASKSMNEEIKQIAIDQCFCTHGCWLLVSMFGHLARKYGIRNLGPILRSRGMLNLVEVLRSRNFLGAAMASFLKRRRRLFR